MVSYIFQTHDKPQPGKVDENEKNQQGKRKRNSKMLKNYAKYKILFDFLPGKESSTAAMEEPGETSGVPWPSTCFSGTVNHDWNGEFKSHAPTNKKSWNGAFFRHVRLNPEMVPF